MVLLPTVFGQMSNQIFVPEEASTAMVAFEGAVVGAGVAFLVASKNH